ncbi:MAG: cupin domain-containing protein [Sphingomonas sp.]
MKHSLAVAGVATLLGAAAVQAAGGPELLRLTPAEIAVKPSISAGAGTSGIAAIRTTILYGDPTRPGAYTIALKVPANTRIAAHSHRDERTAVVVSGTWYFGFGDHASDALRKALPPGSFYTEPANVTHFARTGATPAIVYISGYGPTDTRYVDADAAPR